MTLIQVERLKMQASKLNMKRIEIHGKHCILTFGEEAKIKHDILMKAIQENPAISLTGPHSIKLEYNHTFFTSIQSLLLLIQQ
jgi:transcription-repair coupling factor (superfamily II helicase)